MKRTISVEVGKGSVNHNSRKFKAENVDGARSHLIMESMKQVSEVTQGQELNDTPDTSQSSGQGFTELGKVYKDPSSGKLIMVEG